jgi:hypothetical protein
MALAVATPLVDLIVLVAATVDLRRGGEAALPHALARVHFDTESGTWIFICVHSTTRGPAGGGTRMRTYATP